MDGIIHDEGGALRFRTRSSAGHACETKYTVIWWLHLSFFGQVEDIWLKLRHPLTWMCAAGKGLHMDCFAWMGSIVNKHSEGGLLLSHRAEPPRWTHPVGASPQCVPSDPGSGKSIFRTPQNAK